MTGPTAAPTAAVQSQLHAAGARTVAGADECGRGSYCGPVCVGIVVAGRGPVPPGLADSKKLTARRRAALVDPITAWADGIGIGLASAAEIDAHGMSAALKLAAERALAQLPTEPDALILDGPHDYLHRPDLVHPAIKADATELVVAAASVLAKEYRDALMRELDLELPGYDLARNAGYNSPAHWAALLEHGPTAQHRTSWKFMHDLPDRFAHLRRGPAAAQTALF